MIPERCFVLSESEAAYPPNMKIFSQYGIQVHLKGSFRRHQGIQLIPSSGGTRFAAYDIPGSKNSRVKMRRKFVFCLISIFQEFDGFDAYF